MGIENWRLRTDPEESMVAVAKQMQHKWMSKMILEKAPVASHQSIGGVERYHRMLQDEVRTIKLECEKNFGDDPLRCSSDNLDCSTCLLVDLPISQE